jgi:hypothetical protein
MWSSRDSSVSIVTRLRVRQLEEQSLDFCSPPRPDEFRGPPTLLSNGYRKGEGSFPGGRTSEADKSPPSSAQVKNA